MTQHNILSTFNNVMFSWERSFDFKNPNWLQLENRKKTDPERDKNMIFFKQFIPFYRAVKVRSIFREKLMRRSRILIDPMRVLESS